MERHDRDPLGLRVSSRAVRRTLAAVIVVAAVFLGGCATTNTSPVLPPGSTEQVTESPPAETTARFQIRCIFVDLPFVGDYSSLNETWASTNYMRIDHCITRYVGPPPFSLTEEETAVTQIASSRLTDPGSPEQLFLDIYSACTRANTSE